MLERIEQPERWWCRSHWSRLVSRNRLEGQIGIGGNTAQFLANSTVSRAALISAFTTRTSMRSAARCPPFQAFLATLARPSGLTGPVACCHGFQVLISSDCLALRSVVQPLTMVCLQ